MAKILTVTKQFEFCYGHKLPGYEGKCNRFHGHNATVEVEVAGKEPNGYPTMVIDFSKLKQIVGSVLESLDHQDLTSFFGDHDTEPMPPTAEVICGYLFNQISNVLPEGVKLVRLRVTETPSSWAEMKDYPI